MSEIKPIQTRYKGYHFRSRLEARWAVFFDKMKFNWEYENEGFDLGNGVWYLPDFCITSIDGSLYYYEIKPKNYSGGDNKFSILRDAFTEEYNSAEDENKPPIREVRLLVGDPVDFLGGYPEDMICPRCGLIHVDGYCFSCDMHTESGHNNPIYESVIYKNVKYTPNCGYIEFADLISAVHFRTFINVCAQSARSARFEHGQNGAT